MMRKNASELKDMAEVRTQIDAIDFDVIALLAERQAHVDRMGEIKQVTGVSAAAPTRFAAVLATVRARAAAAGFDPDTAEAMWQVMIEANIAREERVLGKGGIDG